MLIVHIHHPESMTGRVNDLRIALEKLVPLVMSSEMGPLGPGDAIVYPHRLYSVKTGLVEVRALDYPDRRNLNERAEKLKKIIEKETGIELNVWISLEKAGGAFVDQKAKPKPPLKQV